MAKKRNRSENNPSILFDTEPDTTETSDTATENQRQRNFFSSLGRGERIAAVAVCLLLVVGALGAGLGEKIGSVFSFKTLNQKTDQPAQNNSLLASLNPFAAVVTLPTPQLSKEYIYAGSRMLAVEDANASALPPADLGVWRPSNGTWYVLNSSNQQWTTQQWGSTSTTDPDKPVPGDYDGDGKTDFSVFRPSTGTWYIINSSSGTAGYPFGLSSDTPAQADYDGDGKTDAALYRPSTGYWYIVKSSNLSTISQQLGTTGDVPTPGDFDGDGRADIAIWRESNLTFYVLRSSDGSLQTQVFGAANDKPVIGDYDGDGKADFTMRRGNDWIIRSSATGKALTAITWQTAADKAVQNDYDGDGKVDIAVWRDSTGVWYIRNSRDLSTRTVQWGQSGDIPVPAFYRR